MYGDASAHERSGVKDVWSISLAVSGWIQKLMPVSDFQWLE